MPKQDDNYKLKFNPKKKCSRCEHLGAFVCEHSVSVRDSMRMSFEERGGRFYTSPKTELKYSTFDKTRKKYNSLRVKKTKAPNTTDSIEYDDNDELSEEERLALINKDRINKLGKPEMLIRKL